jgi:hypothetical protein
MLKNDEKLFYILTALLLLLDRTAWVVEHADLQQSTTIRIGTT